MKKVSISLMCGIAAILITIVSYVTIIGNVFQPIVSFITLIGVVIPEVIVTILACRSKGEPRKVTAAFVGSVMPIVSIILSYVYINNYPEKYASYFGWYFIIFAIVFLIVAILWKFDNSKQSENAAFQNAKENMLYLRKLVKCVMAEPNAVNYTKELNAIEEKLHFSNDSVVTPSDEMISQLIVDLRNNITDENYDVANQIQLILKEIDCRNILANKAV